MIFKISEGCFDEEYPECREGKGKISFDPRFFNVKASERYSGEEYLERRKGKGKISFEPRFSQ